MAGKIFECETLEDGGYAFYFRPPEFPGKEAKEHLLASQKEFLMALRSLVDYAIQRTEKEEGGGRTKIEVS